MTLTVDLILSDSIAEHNNIETGDTIISVNGVEMKDFIDYIYFESPEVFNKYIDTCRSLQLYDTGGTVTYGDKLITLSTCEYSRKDGRMVIVAKKLPS